MPTPAYTSAANFVKGVPEAEAAINIESFEQSFEDPKEYIESKAGSNTGFVSNFNPSSSCTISGEVNTATLDIVGGFAFASDEVIANAVDGYGTAAGGWYMENFSLSASRGSLMSASASFIRHPDIA